MKCIKDTNGKVTRVSNEEASKKVASGEYQQLLLMLRFPKKEWKTWSNTIK